MLLKRSAQALATTISASFGAADAWLVTDAIEQPILALILHDAAYGLS